MIKKIFATALLLIPLFAHGAVRFNDCAISDNNRIAFIMENDHNTVPAAILSNAAGNDALQLLTSDALNMKFLSRDILQLRGSYGTLWCDTTPDSDNIYKITQKEVFNKALDSSLFSPPVTIDNDIRYACALVQNESFRATGNLILKEIKSQKTLTLDSGTLLDYDNPHALWAANGLLIYEKANAIYFANPDSLFDGTEVETEYRKITSGTISAIKCVGNTITYITGDTVYRVSAKELYTLSLYGSLTGLGRPIGHLASNFNSARDEFFIDNECKNIVTRSGNTFTLYTQTEDGLDVVAQKTFVGNSYLTLRSNVFFVKDGLKTLTYLWQTTLPFPDNNSTYTIKTYVNIYNIDNNFELVLTAEDCNKLILSPNSTLCATPCKKSLYIYDTKDWRRLDTLEGEAVSNAAWQDDDTLFAATPSVIYKYIISERHKFFVTLTSAATLSFLDNVNLIAIAPNKSRYIYNTTGNFWKEYEETFPKQKRSSKLYRVFTGKTSNSSFYNALYVRDLKTNASRAVFSDSIKKQTDTKRVALIFDAYDSNEGLGKILYTLGRHNVDATFFLNGDFISRYPKETRLLSNTSYECASMFYTKAPLTGGSFTATKDFIKQGLGRLEDEYFRVTGKEVSLLWHAPYYFVTDEIIKYGADAGYLYMKNTNLTQENIYRTGDSQSISPVIMAKRLVNIYMNSITANTFSDVVIPITVGESDSADTKAYRPTGVYQTIVDNLDILINAILSYGYEIVNVRALL